MLLQLYLCLILYSGFGHTLNLTVHLDKPGHEISPILWGIFFEEINHAGDGGLYAELIRNRALSIKYGGSLDGYSVYHTGSSNGSISIAWDHPLNSVLENSLQLTVTAQPSLAERVGISNTGYWGIPIRPDYTTYNASFYAKSTTGFNGPLTVSIESIDGTVVYASSTVPVITGQFEKYEVTLTPLSDLIQDPTLNAHFVISTTGQSGIGLGDSINFNMISLFPPTWKNKPNGMRIDLAEKLADSKPSFFRFPGGAFLHGYSLESRFNWEESIGAVEFRPGHPNLWGYHCTDGMGLLEGLEFAEDLGVEVILGVYAGNSGNNNSVPIDEMGPYIDSVLNEIEYITGNTSTTWGSLRAEHGHPTPFPLTYVEVGNEDWFTDDYETRYPLFYDAITAKYPELVIIATMDVESRPMPMKDDHFYHDMGGFPSRHGLYDNAPRDGPQIFVGEYATREGQNIEFDGYHEAITAAAIEDASFMIAIERNSDIVKMACYAPLFAHVEDFRWTPDAIYFNGVQSFATPAWWVQYLFSTIRGDTYIPSDYDGILFHGASRNTVTNTLVLKIVNTNAEDVFLDMIELIGVQATQGGQLTVLTGNGQDFNTPENPLKVAPYTTNFTVTENRFSYNVTSYSLNIFEIKL